MLVAVEKATSIQSFFAGSDVQTQTELTNPAKYKTMNPSSEIALRNNNADEPEPYAMHGEFFTVVQNCDGSYSMGDQDLSLNDDRVSKFLHSYRKPDSLTLVPLPIESEKNISEFFNMSSYDISQELIAKPTAIFKNNTQSLPILKPIFDNPHLVDKIITKKIDNFTTMNDSCSEICSLTNNKQRKSSDQPVVHLESCRSRSQHHEIFMKRDETCKQTLCEVTFKEQTEKRVMNSCMESGNNIKLMAEFDKWSDASSKYLKL